MKDEYSMISLTRYSQKYYQRQLVALLALIIMTSTLSACNSTRTSSNDEQFEHMIDENTHGYYFDLYTEDSKDKERNGIIELNTYNDSMYFDVENAGAERQLSV